MDDRFSIDTLFAASGAAANAGPNAAAQTLIAVQIIKAANCFIDISLLVPIFLLWGGPRLSHAHAGTVSFSDHTPRFATRTAP
jgi:hypothetical protein